jgi:hypothetical protein
MLATLSDDAVMKQLTVFSLHAQPTAAAPALSV